MKPATIQRRLGLEFNDERLLLQAFTHRSWPYEQSGAAAQESDNERLEYLGDAVLAFVVTRLLYDRFPDMPEGELTRLRAALVRSETLASIAVELGLGAMLRLGRGEEQNGGRQKSNILGDALEALLGAVFLDQGQAAAEAYIERLLAPRIRTLLAEDLVDARSRLQQWSQAALQATPAYATLAESGPGHQKNFTVAVLIGGEELGTGSGNSKQAAAQAAAQVALDFLQREGRSGGCGVE